jgi:hypothetical protein
MIEKCPQMKQGGVSHCGLAIYIKNIYIKEKRKKKWKLKYFTMQKLHNLQKISCLKETRYYNSIVTNLKFQHKPKYHLSKILI